MIREENEFKVLERGGEKIILMKWLWGVEIIKKISFKKMDLNWG